MKKFKEIKKEINETNLISPNYAHGRYKVDKKDKETVQQIRAAIANELNKSFMSPKTALQNLQTKLNLINLDFDLPTDDKCCTVGATVKLPLKKATSVFGKDGDTPYDEYITDDTATGLTLEIKVDEDENSLYKLTSTVK
tara:strand:+ start:742 stop:1161 length:420 start_codon:yes stop_codon:yes gene_type:complete